MSAEVTTRRQIQQELTWKQIQREIDAEYTAWQKEWDRDHPGTKPTPNLKWSWYRSRLIREIYERRAGIR